MSPFRGPARPRTADTPSRSRQLLQVIHGLSDNYTSWPECDGDRRERRDVWPVAQSPHNVMAVGRRRARSYSGDGPGLAASTKVLVVVDLCDGRGTRGAVGRGAGGWCRTVRADRRAGAG